MQWRLYYFNPPDVTEPDWRQTYYYHIRSRANHILKSRKPREIRLMMFALRHLHASAFASIFEDLDDEGRTNINPARMLLHAMEHFDIGKFRALPDVTWPELFATLALGLCNRAFIFEKEVFEPTPHVEQVDPPEVDINPERVAHAAEAVAIAESLLSAQGDATRIHNKQALNKRYTRRNELKDDFVDFYLEKRSEFHTRSDAARCYYDALSAEDRLELAPSRNRENAVRTLREHLAKVIGTAKDE